jgi:hypothetical protein
VRRVGEAHRRQNELPPSLDPDVRRTVDHDLGYGVVGQQPLQRPVSQDVVGDVGGQHRPVLASDLRLLRQPRRDLGGDLRLERAAIDLGIEDLAAEILDDAEMDPVLDVGERVESQAGNGRMAW